MLDLEKVDLGELCVALEDNSPDHSWWFDPRTGEVEPHFESFLDEDEPGDPEERGLVPVEPVDSRAAYADMADFTERVRDPGARELLDRAIAGRGAFRRFKDTLFELPELREAWFGFKDARMERRALQWLGTEGLVDAAAAERAAGERPDPEPPELSGAFDAHAIARAVAVDLGRLYGGRLERVLLFGSWARGDAHPDSDIDLAIVLDRVDSVWDERRRMEDILWRHSIANDTVVTVLPISAADVERADSPTLVRVRAESASIA